MFDKLMKVHVVFNGHLQKKKGAKFFFKRSANPIRWTSKESFTIHKINSNSQ